MPKISVIIPNYNHATYLKQRIDSVLNQTFQDFEVIILDDYSPDNSRQVIDQYKGHPKVSHIVYNSTNSGSTFKQWKTGIDLAQSENIWLAESDDYADPQFLEILLKKMDDNSSIGLVYCQSWSVNSENVIMSLVSDWIKIIDHTRWEKDFENTGINECSNYLLTQNTIVNASSVIFKKSIFIDVFENNSLRLTGDWLLWINILLQCDIAYVSKPLNYFRKHTNNVRNNPQVQMLELKECVFVVEQLRSKIKAQPEKIKMAYQIIVDRVISRFITDLSLTKKDISLLLQREFPDNSIPIELKLEIEAFYIRNYLTYTFGNFFLLIFKKNQNKIIKILK